MSYMSASENVGFSIPTNLSEASCATQFKMAVGGGSDPNSFNHEPGDEQSYLPQVNDNFFLSKFKIDPNELYTFQDSDVIASEITVSHTEDNLVYTEHVDVKNCSENAKEDLDFIGSSYPNGDTNVEAQEVVKNGYHPHIALAKNTKELKTVNTKVHKLNRDPIGANPSSEHRKQSQCLKIQTSTPSGSVNNSISSVNTNSIPELSPKTGGETFLDVFKREQGLVHDSAVPIKIEPGLPPPPPVAPPVTTSAKKASSAKPSSSKPRRGRGPAVHEALQRIQKRVLTVRNREWLAPGEEMFDCGPLIDSRPHPYTLESSSSDDDERTLCFGDRMSCVEEDAAESRGARLAFRRAALRRQVAQASTALRLAHDHRKQRTLAAVVKKQLTTKGSTRLPQETVNHLLASRGMCRVFSSTERRELRTSGWSGGDSLLGQSACLADKCSQTAMPCASHCVSHIALSGSQRLFAACAAVFAGGERCSQPLLPLQEHTPLCTEHAWKRDNYDKIVRDVKPRKPARARPYPGTRPRAKRRRRPPLRPAPASLAHHLGAAARSLSELNVCSNSSTYDSSEDTGIGGLSESEFIVAASNSNEMEVCEVGQVPPDDILDLPDEAFTEFFNQAEANGSFGESSDLARALEAVLDERALDSLADCVLTHPHSARTKMPVAASLGVEMSPVAPS